MKINETLTKENFWDEMMTLYPKATKIFCEWIDEYKAAVNWNALFVANEDTMQLHSSKYKYHEIPYEMQQGIWLEFLRQTLPEYFEQVERHMSQLYDFPEDVKEAFAEIEKIEEEIES